MLLIYEDILLVRSLVRCSLSAGVFSWGILLHGFTRSPHRTEWRVYSAEEEDGGIMMPQQCVDLNSKSTLNPLQFRLVDRELVQFGVSRVELIPMTDTALYIWRISNHRRIMFRQNPTLAGSMCACLTGRRHFGEVTADNNNITLRSFLSAPNMLGHSSWEQDARLK